MAFTGFGPDITFLGVPRCDLDDVSTYADADIVIRGAPLDGGPNYRSGTRFGPSALRRPATCRRTIPVPRQPLLEGREVDEQLRLIAAGKAARRRGEGTAGHHHYHH
jgi:arginase family enzyme